MRYLPPLTTIVDISLALTGFSLAGCSLYLLIRMTLLVTPAPSINGKEFLSIYAKPKSPNLARERERFKSGVDFAPVGNLATTLSRNLLTDFDLIDATAHAATLRTLQGRILIVSPGATLAGGGKVLSIQRIRDQWVVRTTMGIIRKD